MYEIRFNLNVTKKQCQDVSRGLVHQVIARSHNGQTIQFPAHNLKPFVTHNGIKGVFRILYSDDNKLIRIEKIS